ncbi:hypothetical protein PG999_014688 [Apiospora kogelbergensis]|uniref:Uncharacterized protein n=1 Tax=Apiospora kogelbergensis TaxID=1337665 RepID=A0AAW0QDI2_9PEZI
MEQQRDGAIVTPTQIGAGAGAGAGPDLLALVPGERMTGMGVHTRTNNTIHPSPSPSRLGKLDGSVFSFSPPDLHHHQTRTLDRFRSACLAKSQDAIKPTTLDQRLDNNNNN